VKKGACERNSNRIVSDSTIERKRPEAARECVARILHYPAMTESTVGLSFLSLNDANFFSLDIDGFLKEPPRMAR
jgi:hypothetical protein